MERIIRRVGLIGIIPTTLTALAGAGVLMALDDDPAATGSTGSSLWSPFLANQEPEQDGPSLHRVGAPDVDGYLRKLAGKLGVSEEQLKEAMKQTSLEMLEESVASGEVSEEQAAKIRAMIEDGAGLPFFRGGFAIGEALPGSEEFGMAGPFGFGKPLLADDAVADFLGIPAEDLRAELNSGQTLAEVAAAHGKSRDEIKAFLVEQQEERLSDAVAAGKLSEPEAAKIREGFAEHVEHMLDAEIRIHVNGDGPEMERFEGFSGAGPSRIFPWRPAPAPVEPDNGESAY